MGPAGKDSGGSVVGIAGAKIDSLEALSKYFVMPEKHVAKELGICLTSLKKLCRHYGITRWPYRKLKSIQRTMAMVQDDAASSGIAAQLQAAGIVIEGSVDGAENGQRAAAEPVVKHTSTGSKGGGKNDGKKRKPYTVNGKTVMMTEEEKKLLSISMGEKSSTGLTLDVKREPGDSKRRSHTASPSSYVISPGSTIFTPSFPVTPPVFSCEAVGFSLLVRNWQELWTQMHLEQRLLKPLGGIGLNIVDGGATAVLDFENERTAQRAELICRAAAKAAVENLKNRPKSRSRTPPLKATPGLIKSESMTPVPSGLGSGKITLDIPRSGSGSGSAVLGDPDSTGSVSEEVQAYPMFRTPISPGVVFGMWDTSTLTLPGVDSHSEESLASGGGGHSFLDSSGPGGAFSSALSSEAISSLMAPGSEGILHAISAVDAAGSALPPASAMSDGGGHAAAAAAAVSETGGHAEGGGAGGGGYEAAGGEAEAAEGGGAEARVNEQGVGRGGGGGVNEDGGGQGDQIADTVVRDVSVPGREEDHS